MIDLSSVYRTYKTKRRVVHALADVDLHIDAGEFVVVQGPSGSGKTTLLWTVGGMLHPTSGRVVVDGTDLYRTTDLDAAVAPGTDPGKGRGKTKTLSSLSAAERNCFRAKHVGFVFQASHLLPYLSLRDNVRLGQLDELAPDGVDGLLERLGLAARAGHRPGELSVGEQQRAALARAIIKRPKLILADEPTGNLDPKNADEVLRVLRDFNEKGGTVVLVTHGRDAEGLPGRVVRLEAGRVVDCEAAPRTELG